MAGFAALSLFAASLAAAASTPVSTHSTRTAVSTPVYATVRILPGAKVSLGSQAEAEGYRLTEASITDEDGRRRPAKLVEFQ